MNSGAALVDREQVAGSGSDPFVDLLSPVALPEFFRDHWERQALLIRGSARKLQSLALGGPGFAFRLACLVTRREIQVGYTNREGFHEQINGIEPWRTPDHYRAGMTIACAGLEHVSEPLGRLAASLKSYAGLASIVRITSFTSPDDGGFGLHFDDQSVFLIQVEGAKRWRYSTLPVVLHPPDNYVPEVLPTQVDESHWPWLKIQHPVLEDLEECTLHPGDILYLPPGCWHQGFGVGHSSALSLSCMPLRFARLVMSVLADRLSSEPAWRRNAPPALGVTPPQGSPSAVVEWIGENLDLLRDVVAELSIEDFEPHWRDWRARARLDSPPAMQQGGP